MREPAGGRSHASSIGFSGERILARCKERGCRTEEIDFHGLLHRVVLAV